MSKMQVKDINDINSLFKEMVGDILENGLEAELDQELGYSKYDYRNKDTSNSRNGYSSVVVIGYGAGKKGIQKKSAHN